jgi:hypothetical protein
MLLAFVLYEIQVNGNTKRKDIGHSKEIKKEHINVYTTSKVYIFSIFYRYKNIS